MRVAQLAPRLRDNLTLSMQAALLGGSREWTMVGVNPRIAEIYS